MRMAGWRQVELGVRGVQVGRPRRPVGHPGGSDRTEHGGQAPLVTRLDPGVSHSGHVGDVFAVRFGGGAMVQVRVEL